MWLVLAICSALGLGFYDIMKKLSLRDNNVPAYCCSIPCLAQCLCHRL